MKRLLIQTQLSNYDTKGNFILECDSGWQMVVGRCREMLKLNPDLQIDVMGPRTFNWYNNDSSVITPPHKVNPDMDWHYLYAYNDPTQEDRGRLNYIQHEIMPNALATRYDFNFEPLSNIIGLQHHKKHPELKYDAVYINDPMHLRNFKAMFHLKAGYQPRFYVHSHFIDNPECPKFPTDASLWLGQCEAAIKADFNFWQCGSAMEVFFDSMERQFQPAIVDQVRAKSLPWDDGYSSEEINTPPDMKNVRFDPSVFDGFRKERKKVIFVPNRIGGRGRSSDYTNCGKFMFDLLPHLAKMRIGKGLNVQTDFVVIAGNPSQKFFNHELEKECGPNGYVSLVPDALNRDEFKLVARNSDIALGLYDQDAYGGTVARECIDLGCMPLWLDNFEYSVLARSASSYPFLVKPDWSNFLERTCALLDLIQYHRGESKYVQSGWLPILQRVVRARCSYEATTPLAMQVMGLL